MSDTSAANGNGHALGPSVTHRWLQDLLYDKRVTQRALADAWGINEAMVSRLIRRGAGNITLDRVDALADLVRVPAEELLQRFRDGGCLRPRHRRLRLHGVYRQVSVTSSCATGRGSSSVTTARCRPRRWLSAIPICEAGPPT